jgi:hypothetical protein
MKNNGRPSSQLYRSSDFDKHFSSLFNADSTIDKLINDICQKQWEKEVIQKKLRPDAINYAITFGVVVKELEKTFD